MIVQFIAVQDIVELHRLTISEHGGSHGLRDRGLLESASARPENLANYVPNASVAELAATLAWGLVKNHAFIDGNKRIGLAALLTFLRVNHHWLNSSEEQTRVMILKAAAGEIMEEEWSAWVVAAAQPRP